MKPQKEKIISVIAIIVLALMVITATYAYFQAEVSDPAAVDVSVTANTVDTFTFSTGDAISINLNQENFASGAGNQIGSTTASAKLTANNKTNTVTEHYNLYLNISDNSFGYSNSDTYPEMLLIVKNKSNTELTSISGLNYKTITDGNGESISGFDITNKIGLISLISNQEITTTSTITDTWNITILFVNYNFNQSQNAGQSFSGQVIISKDSLDDYTTSTINTLNTSLSGSNLTVDLTLDNGTSEIDTYYYAIEEKDSLAYVPSNNTLKVSRLANTLTSSNLTYEESTSSSHTFTNIDSTKTYEISVYAKDKKKIKTNTYEYAYSASYALPTISGVELSKTSSSITATVTATKGMNDISKYYYSIDGGNTFAESTSNSYTFSNLLSGSKYRVVVKVKDSNNLYSNPFLSDVFSEKAFYLALNDYTFNWEAVEGASSYQIYSDDTLLTTTTDTTAEIYGYYNDPGTYSIKVKALNSSNNGLSSSNTISYTLEQLNLDLSNVLKTVDKFDDSAVLKGNFAIGFSYNFRIYELGGTASIVSLNNSNYNINYIDARNEDVFFESYFYWDDFQVGLNYNFSKKNFCWTSGLCYNSSLSDFDYNNTGMEYYYDQATNYIVSKSLINIRGDCIFVQFFEPGKIASDWYVITVHATCLSSNTEVYVYDKKKKKFKKKKIGDIDYDDEILCWNFDKGCFSISKPIWIKKGEQTNKYNLLKFSDGSTLETIDQHRIYNKEAGMFTYPMTDDTPIGTTTFNSSGEYVKLVSKEVIEKPIDYYNIMTEYHVNLFANDILTSSRLSNMYKIENMKYVYEEKRDNGYDLSMYDEKLVKGLRLKEQNVEESKLKTYVDNMLKIMKKR